MNVNFLLFKTSALNKGTSRRGFTLIGLPFAYAKRSYKRKDRHGFTLIELMIAISIVAILSTIGFSAYSQSQIRARDAKRKQDLRAVAVALELFYQAHKRYPCASTTWGTWTISTSTNWITDVGSCTGGANISFEGAYLNKLPQDPVNTSSPLVGSTGYGYVYWSGDPGAVGNCTAGAGQRYTLVTRLENSNDPETVLNAQTKSCEGIIYANVPATYRPENFVITSN